MLQEKGKAVARVCSHLYGVLKQLQQLVVFFHLNDKMLTKDKNYFEYAAGKRKKNLKEDCYKTLLR